MKPESTQTAPAEPALRRPMQLDDLQSVLRVEALVYSHPWTHGHFADALRAGYFTELWLDENGQPLAYAVAMVGVDELHLLNLSVAPPWQGQGHGRAMVKRLQQFGIHQRLASLWLEVRVSNQRARQLYGRLGFSEVGLRPAYYPAASGREDALVMRCLLGPEPSLEPSHELKPSHDPEQQHRPPASDGSLVTCIEPSRSFAPSSTSSSPPGTR